MQLKWISGRKHWNAISFMLRLLQQQNNKKKKTKCLEVGAFLCNLLLELIELELLESIFRSIFFTANSYWVSKWLLWVFQREVASSESKHHPMKVSLLTIYIRFSNRNIFGELKIYALIERLRFWIQKSVFWKGLNSNNMQAVLSIQKVFKNLLKKHYLRLKLLECDI